MEDTASGNISHQIYYDKAGGKSILFWKNKGVKKKYLTGKNKCDNLAKVIDMEKIGRQVFLYDFYGELLTEHQKRVYEDVVLNDMSLSEIAEELGTQRQGNDGRNKYRYYNGHRKLTVQLSRNSTQKTYRNKHSRQYQWSSDQRAW